MYPLQFVLDLLHLWDDGAVPQPLSCDTATTSAVTSARQLPGRISILRQMLPRGGQTSVGVLGA